MNLGFFGDLHYSIRPPARRSEDYGDQLLAKLEYIQSARKKVRVSDLFSTGDWFHRKLHHSYSFSELNKLLGCLKGRIYSIIGNHDITGYQVKSERYKAIGALLRSGKVRWLDKKPYINDLVEIRGVSYKAGYNAIDNFTESRFTTEDGQLRILITHAALFKSRPPYDDHILLSDLKKAAKKIEPDIIINGHVHSPDFFVEEYVPGKYVFQLGTIGRDSIDLKKYQPRFLILRVTNDNWTHKWMRIPIEKDVWVAEADDVIDDTEEEIKALAEEIVEEGQEMNVNDLDDLVDLGIKKLGLKKKYKDFRLHNKVTSLMEVER